MGVIGWLVAFFSLTANCLAQVGGETTSLDSSTNGITFKKLPSVEVVLDNEPKPIELKLDVLRAEVAYELVVYIINNSSAEFLPVKASTSCNCVIGAIPNSSIEPGGKGPIVIRLKPKKNSSELRQLVRVESSDGRFVDLNIKANVNRDFLVSQNEFQISKDKIPGEFAIELKPQYPDVILESVRVQFQRNLFNVPNVLLKEGNISLRLQPSPSFDDRVSKEITEVLYSVKDSNIKHNQSIELRFKSDEVTAKPRIVVMKHEGDTDQGRAIEKLSVQGEVTLHNLPTNHGLQTESRFHLRFQDEDLAVSGNVVSISPTEITGAAKVKFRFEVDRERFAEQSKLRSWVPVSMEIGTFNIYGVKFVFVDG